MTRLTRRDVLQSLLAAGWGGLGAMTATAVAAADAESLRSIGQRKGLQVGSAIGMPAQDSTQRFGFQDPAYRELMARECSAVVCENEMKWQWLRPSAKAFTFARADQIRDWTKASGLALRGHTLLWQDPVHYPDWLTAFQFGSQPRAQAEALLVEHVSTVCRRYAADITSWDVVNEAVAPDSGELRRNVFADKLGGVEAVEIAFRTAREHAPKAQLVYNDFMGWGPSSAKHRAGVLELLAALKKRGAPIDALGLQGHVGTSGDGRAIDPEGAQEREWRRFLDEANGMGLELLVTEFDVNDRYLSADLNKRDAEVAAVARTYLDITLSYRQLRSFTFWGLADHLSWLQNRWPRSDGLPKRPCPYDDKLQPKAMRRAVADALRAMPARV
jgi:endo-1,4-beta-xylanase